LKQTITLDDLKSTACWKLNLHLEAPVKKKRAKYNNVAMEFDGKKFQSTKECHRYIFLRARLVAGEIKDLECQKKYLLIEGNEIEKKCEYWADFAYTECYTGLSVTEDVKSAITRKLSTYIMKRKLMLSIYNIQISEM
jgi:hypothetical protein